MKMRRNDVDPHPRMDTRLKKPGMIGLEVVPAISGKRLPKPFHVVLPLKATGLLSAARACRLGPRNMSDSILRGPLVGASASATVVVVVPTVSDRSYHHRGAHYDPHDDPGLLGATHLRP